MLGPALETAIARFVAGDDLGLPAAAFILERHRHALPKRLRESAATTLGPVVVAELQAWRPAVGSDGVRVLASLACVPAVEGHEGLVDAVSGLIERLTDGAADEVASLVLARAIAAATGLGVSPQLWTASLAGMLAAHSLHRELLVSMADAIERYNASRCAQSVHDRADSYSAEPVRLDTPPAILLDAVLVPDTAVRAAALRLLRDTAVDEAFRATARACLVAEQVALTAQLARERCTAVRKVAQMSAVDLVARYLVGASRCVGAR